MATIGKKENSLKVRKRLEAVTVELLKMRPTVEVVKHFAAEWDVADDTVYAYIRKLNTEGAVERQKAPFQSRVQYRLRQAEKMLESFMRDGKSASAVQIFNSICKIEGLFVAQEIAHTIVGGIEGLSVKQKEDQLNDLLKKREQYLKEQEKLRVAA